MDKGHWYTEQGELTAHGIGFPSPTTILAVRANPVIDRWVDRVGAEEAERKRAESAHIGTVAHKEIEDFFKNGTMGKSLYFDSFAKWLAVALPENCLAEQFVISYKHNYAGTADLICQIKGEDYIVDFKTGQHLQPSMGLQLRAYERAFFEMRGVPARQLVVQLVPGLKRGYRTKEYNEPFDVFLAHKKIFDWQESHSRRPNWNGGIIDLS